jgi:hypothetical protein
MKKLIICIFPVLYLLAACNKKPCLPPSVTISGTEAIFAGDAISLKAESVSGATYTWTGPNNFSSTEASISITNATINAAGDYIVNVLAGGCENSTSKTVEVLQGPSCSPTNNTISFFTTMTFSSVTCNINSAGRYEISGTCADGDFRIEFYTNPLLKTNAIYDLSTMNTNSYNAFMQIDISGVLANWQATSGKLYVKVVNNKMIATFCGAVFGNIQSTSTKTASGKLSCS